MSRPSAFADCKNATSDARSRASHNRSARPVEALYLSTLLPPPLRTVQRDMNDAPPDGWRAISATTPGAMQRSS
jgi:hypothetical protein